MIFGGAQNHQGCTPNFVEKWILTHVWHHYGLRITSLSPCRGFLSSIAESDKIYDLFSWNLCVQHVPKSRFLNWKNYKKSWFWDMLHAKFRWKSIVNLVWCNYRAQESDRWTQARYSESVVVSYMGRNRFLKKIRCAPLVILGPPKSWFLQLKSWFWDMLHAKFRWKSIVNLVWCHYEAQ